MLDKLDIKAVEGKWQLKWDELKAYHFDEEDKKREVYSIDSPPPFTSGALHMGHMLSYSYFDFAARFKRMQGYNVYYPQGWDCQGFPTELKVEKAHSKQKLSRQEFLEKCRSFTEENIAKMKRQMVAMGFSPDWRYEYKTMSDDYHRRVQVSLKRMLDAGMIYHAKHPVLFCTHCGSAIAKAELEELARETILNYVTFGSTDGNITIATTRPELLHACVAVFVNPADERYRHLAGKHATTPLFNKQVPILADPEVDMAFGTGIVMVCTFGDKADVVWAYRHNLPMIEAMAENGLLKNAGPYDGLAGAKARERILEDLKTQGLLEKQEKISQTVRTHDRCGKPVEFLPSTQWFMKTKDWKEKIVAAAREMRWIPEFSIQYLIDWAQGLEWDWVISRQRIYGTPMPFWYCRECGAVYAPKESELPVDPSKDPSPVKKCGAKVDGKACGGDVVPELATCDCWVDSSITPLVISRWPDDASMMKKTYPATLRPQGVEIIRTWAFYTIFRCLFFTEKPCFRDVLIHGMVLGTDGKKMSKSVGNYEDPDVLLGKYAADALRQWAALSGAFARDRPFSYKDVETGQAFITKLWNAAKFIEKAVEDFDPRTTSIKNLELRTTDRWILSECQKVVMNVTEAMKRYDYYATITAVHNFFWHSFCDYYLEEVKYRVYDKSPAERKSRRAAQYALYNVLLGVLKLAAPIAPFVTEEIFQSMFKRDERVESIHVSVWPSYDETLINEAAEKNAGVLAEILAEARKFKAQRGLPLNDAIAHAKITASEEVIKEIPSIEKEIKSVGRIQELELSVGEGGLSVELSA